MTFTWADFAACIQAVVAIIAFVLAYITFRQGKKIKSLTDVVVSLHAQTAQLTRQADALYSTFQLQYEQYLTSIKPKLHFLSLTGNHGEWMARFSIKNAVAIIDSITFAPEEIGTVNGMFEVSKSPGDIVVFNITFNFSILTFPHETEFFVKMTGLNGAKFGQLGVIKWGSESTPVLTIMDSYIFEKPTSMTTFLQN